MDIIGTTRNFLDAPFKGGLEEVDALHLALIVVFIVSIALMWKAVIDHFDYSGV